MTKTNMIVAVRLVGLNEPTVAAAVALLQTVLGDTVTLAAPHQGRHDWISYGSLHIGTTATSELAQLRAVVATAERFIDQAPHIPAGGAFLSHGYQDLLTAVQQFRGKEPA